MEGVEQGAESETPWNGIGKIKQNGCQTTDPGFHPVPDAQATAQGGSILVPQQTGEILTRPLYGKKMTDRRGDDNRIFLF